MRVVCVCVIVLAVAVGCGKKWTETTPPTQSEVPNTGGATPVPTVPPKQEPPSGAKVDTAPDTSGFSTTDPKAAVQWLAAEFDRREKRDPRDPRFGGKPVK